MVGNDTRKLAFCSLVVFFITCCAPSRSSSLNGWSRGDVPREDIIGLMLILEPETAESVFETELVTMQIREPESEFERNLCGRDIALQVGEHIVMRYDHLREHGTDDFSYWFSVFDKNGKNHQEDRGRAINSKIHFGEDATSSAFEMTPSIRSGR